MFKTVYHIQINDKSGFSKNKTKWNISTGTPLAVQWLELHTCIAEAQVQSWLGELRSHMLCSTAEEKKKLRVTFLFHTHTHTQILMWTGNSHEGSWSSSGQQTRLAILSRSQSPPPRSWSPAQWERLQGSADSGDNSAWICTCSPLGQSDLQLVILGLEVCISRTHTRGLLIVCPIDTGCLSGRWG